MGYEAEDASAFLDELIDAQVLVSELQIPVTTNEGTVRTIVNNLRAAPACNVIADRLEAIQNQLEQMNAHRGVLPRSAYAEVEREIEGLAGKSKSPMTNVVLIREASPTSTLCPSVIQAVLEGVEALHILTGGLTADEEQAFIADDFETRSFRRAFVERYGSDTVPLLEVLDEENGIGWTGEARDLDDPAPLLESVLIPQGEPAKRNRHNRDEGLLHDVISAIADGSNEIRLTSSDLKRLSLENSRLLPHSFAALVTIIAPSAEAIAKGKFRVLMRYIAGASGTALLGRFCFADPMIESIVREQIAAEEASYPDQTLAEIVYLPEGQSRDVTDVVARPVLRSTEILISGGAGTSPRHVLPLADLLVSVKHGRVVLWSRRLEKEVIPRMASAHSPTSGRQLGVYRFLMMIRAQDEANLYWSWTGFEDFRQLPRVTYKKAILWPAQWRVLPEELAVIRKAKDRTHAVTEWRNKRALPRHVLVADRDHELFLDLDSAIGVDVLLAEGKHAETTLKEALGVPVECFAQGEEGEFAHELIVPFTMVPATKKPPWHAETTILRPQRKQMYPLGSEWIFAKCYAGPATIDRLLQDHIPPLINELRRAKLLDKWFFIRYSDPDRHLRLRVHGDAAVLVSQVVPFIARSLAPLLETGALSKIQYDTYMPETSRYGGEVAVRLAEEIFEADSDCVLELMAVSRTSRAGNNRWIIGMRSIHELVSDFMVPVMSRPQIFDHLRTAYGRYPRKVPAQVPRSLARRFRLERDSVVAAIEGPWNGNCPGIPEICHTRSARLEPLVRRLSALSKSAGLETSWTDLVGNYIHMHVNRLMRSFANGHEMVMCDFMMKYYESVLARAGNAGHSAKKNGE